MRISGVLKAFQKLEQSCASSSKQLKMQTGTRNTASFHISASALGVSLLSIDEKSLTKNSTGAL